MKPCDAWFGFVQVQDSHPAGPAPGQALARRVVSCPMFVEEQTNTHLLAPKFKQSKQLVLGQSRYSMGWDNNQRLAASAKPRRALLLTWKNLFASLMKVEEVRSESEPAWCCGPMRCTCMHMIQTDLCCRR